MNLKDFNNTSADAEKKYTESEYEKFRNSVSDQLENTFHCSIETAEPYDMYRAVATVVNSELQTKRWDFNKTRRAVEKHDSDKKKIYYISMEFLMGQSLKNNLYNLGQTEMVRDMLDETNMDITDLYDLEPDAGLGNGGLGRLAACYMDAMASCGYDVTGFCIKYDYGLFKQKLVDGWQVEMPDNWLPGGHVWLNAREDDVYKVGFYGQYREQWGEGGLKYAAEGQDIVEAVPYDMFVSGSGSEAVEKLRLWSGRDTEGFDMASFNNGDFTKAAQENTRAELLSKVLYPADNIEGGKELRLKQQYFMVSASCQNIVRNHYRLHGTLDNFHLKNVIHINDTHPALCIPELMRIFLDDYGCEWDYAWYRVINTISYTNHTVLAEALEKWNDSLVKNMLPRIHMMIDEINRRFRNEMEVKFPGDEGKIDYMAPLGDGMVRMANLSVIGSHKVNGVSSLQSEILKKDLFHDFYLAYPEKFTNVTNGIAYRRWLCQSNPELASLLDECIGPEYRKDAWKMQGFLKYRDNKQVGERLTEIKRSNKVIMSNKIREMTGIAPDPDSLFIVQAKRLHEYKRQLLNALRIIVKYQELLADPDLEMRPETYLFAAKTAPNYFMAKSIIQLIYEIGCEIEKNPQIAAKMKVIFLENYNVSLAEALMPATDISEQISLAGKEASGTGNMKMMINGAVTIGTMDGANVEMFDAVGDDSIFIFGQTAEEVLENLRNGYDAKKYYEENDQLKAAVDSLKTGFNGKSFAGIQDYLLKPSYSIADPYMCLKDFGSYCDVHENIQEAYEDRPRWNRMSATNIAMAARFAADRSIKDYAENIWYTKPIV